MAGQYRHMAWAMGIALLIHAAAFVYWATLPPVPAKAGAGALRLALAGDVRVRETPVAPVVTSDAETPPIVEPDPVPEPEVKVEPVRPPTPDLPVRRAPKPVAPRATAPTQAAASPAANAVAEANQGEGKAAADAGLGDADIEADYVAIVSAWLNRHKRYPRAAARRGLEGRGEVTFIVTRSGRITQFEVSGSTGFAILDRELRAMLERAAPLPSFPSSMPQAQLEIIVPVNFDHQS